MQEDNNTKLEYRAIIKFLILEQVQAKEIFERMTAVYGTECPSYSTVKRWAAEFKRGKQSLEDDPRSGRPAIGCSDENVEAIKELIEADRRLKVRELSASTGLSYGTVYTILHEKLGLSKLSARWIPRMLTAQQKQIRADSSLALLHLYNENPEDFVSRVVTGDETWVHHYDPESKQESMQWSDKGSKPPIKARVRASAGKIMLTVFWDCKGIILVDFLPHKQTINAQYYIEIIRRLRVAIVEKRRGLMTRRPYLLHDNAPSHKAGIAQAAIRESGFHQLDHPPYSPDLAPSDFHLFPYLKKFLRGRHFANDEELIAAVNAWFEVQPTAFYRAGIEGVAARWNKCFAYGGDYVEKF